MRHDSKSIHPSCQRAAASITGNERRCCKGELIRESRRPGPLSYLPDSAKEVSPEAGNRPRRGTIFHPARFAAVNGSPTFMYSVAAVAADYAKRAGGKKWRREGRRELEAEIASCPRVATVRKRGGLFLREEEEGAGQEGHATLPPDIFRLEESITSPFSLIAATAGGSRIHSPGTCHQQDTLSSIELPTNACFKAPLGTAKRDV